MKLPLVINFLGGPGCGKSSTAAHLFALLKWEGITTELVTEYAKDKTWEKSFNTLENQIYVFGKQRHRMWVLENQVDVIVTDSPIILSLVYGRNLSDNFRGLILEQFNAFTSLNYFIDRNKPYYKIGRSQTEVEAKQIDQDILDLLGDAKIPYNHILGGPEGLPALRDNVMAHLERLKQVAPLQPGTLIEVSDVNPQI